MKKIDTGSNFKMAAAAMLKIQLNGHNSVAISHSAQNLVPRLKPTSQKQKYLQILIPQKSKMAADCHFENT